MCAVVQSEAAKYRSARSVQVSKQEYVAGASRVEMLVEMRAMTFAFAL